jgi:hypothetical protein
MGGAVASGANSRTNQPSDRSVISENLLPLTSDSHAKGGADTGEISRDEQIE